jgi:16S rRNA pseudouridine516 synthase
MTSRHARLDRFLSQHLGQSRREVQRLLAAGRVEVDAVPARDGQQRIGPFSRVVLDGQPLQAREAHYLMLNKPAGVVSATRDSRHRTVIDLLDQPFRGELHIAGRLDFHSTGMVLLTNDGVWSRQLSVPENGVWKGYRVTLEKPLNQDYVDAFARGIWFETEAITTRPARLEILSDHEANVFLCEGRYHQIKRMFGRFRNRVVGLHRHSIGGLMLDASLPEGASRPLSVTEILAANPAYEPA